MKLKSVDRFIKRKSIKTNIKISMKKKLTYCFDIDNTICETIGSNYEKSKPKIKIIKLINNLYDNGHTIKLYTARYMGRNDDKISKAKKKVIDLLEINLKNGD